MRRVWDTDSTIGWSHEARLLGELPRYGCDQFVDNPFVLQLCGNLATAQVVDGAVTSYVCGEHLGSES